MKTKILVVCLLGLFLTPKLFAISFPIPVKDKDAIEKEIAAVSAKIYQLKKYYEKYIEHRDLIRGKFVQDSMAKLRGLGKEEIDKVFGKFDDFQSHLDALKESIFVADPKGKDKWGKMLDSKKAFVEIYPELKLFEKRTLENMQTDSLEILLRNRQKYLLDNLTRIQNLAKGLKGIKKINQERIGRYKAMLDQLKTHSTESDSGIAQFDAAMEKNRLLWVIVEIKKEIVTLKQNILLILKTITDDEVRKELLFIEEDKYVF